VPRTLSVLIPVHNEERTLALVLDAVEERPEVSEIVIVDDGSTDGTAEILASRDFGKPTQVLTHPVNRGKGAAIRTAIQAATSELALVQDADLEYDPADYPALLAPFGRPDVSAVYGTRTFSSHTAFSFWFVVGNRLVNLFNNVLFNTYVSDLETGYKLMTLELWKRLDIRANGFELEPEVTGKLLRLGYRIYEVPISYTARSREEGKELTWLDGVRAVLTLLRIRLTSPPSR
jgi:glycosyltransferase involved in cell wall biosynthesis